MIIHDKQIAKKDFRVTNLQHLFDFCHFCYFNESKIIYVYDKSQTNERNSLIIISFCLLDCKTVRIFAYLSTREQSNKRSGMRLKTESETGERR